MITSCLHATTVASPPRRAAAMDMSAVGKYVCILACKHVAWAQSSKHSRLGRRPPRMHIGQLPTPSVGAFLGHARNSLLTLLSQPEVSGRWLQARSSPGLRHEDGKLRRFLSHPRTPNCRELYGRRLGRPSALRHYGTTTTSRAHLFARG